MFRHLQTTETAMFHGSFVETQDGPAFADGQWGPRTATAALGRQSKLGVSMNEGTLN